MKLSASPRSYVCLEILRERKTLLSKRLAELIAVTFLVTPVAAFAGSIDTAFIEDPWPSEWVREMEVGRYPVRWRQRISKEEGLFAGVRYRAPLPQQQVWEKVTDFSGLGAFSPDVKSVRILEKSEHRRVVQFDVKVAWRRLTLTFEIEYDPMQAVRMRLVNEIVGEYRMVCALAPEPPDIGQGTTVEISTWLKPSRPVPNRFVLAMQRMILLRGVKGFLEECESYVQTSN